jgi:hypothetical protein
VAWIQVTEDRDQPQVIFTSITGPKRSTQSCVKEYYGTVTSSFKRYKIKINNSHEFEHGNEPPGFIKGGLIS